MAFGAKIKDAPPQMLGSGGDGNERWIKYFLKGETTVHFLEELDEWTVYWEHFSQAKSRSYPCTGDKSSCPGCTHPSEKENRASKRYLVNALREGYVDLYKIPVSIWDDINRFADKDGGTIMARDYTVVRYEKDGGTQYSVDREDKNDVAVAPYQATMQDHQEALQAAWDQVWGGTDDGTRAETINQDPPKAKRAVKAVVSNLPDDPPSKPEQPAEKDAAQDEDIELTEDQLRSMPKAEILKIYAMCGIEPPEDDLAEYLIAQLA